METLEFFLKIEHCLQTIQTNVQKYFSVKKFIILKITIQIF